MTQALLKDLKAKIEEADQAKAKLVQELKPKFKEIFEPIFDKWPQLQAIRWTQYTPYFNDGEPCEFSVHNLNWSIKGVDDCDWHAEVAGEDLQFEDGILSDWYFNEKDNHYNSDWVVERREKYIKAFGDLETVLAFKADQEKTVDAFGEIPEDVMEDLFGDHAEIIVTRNGLDVTEYEHD